MNYIELQNQEIAHWKVRVYPNSECRRRTHAHVLGERAICKHHVVNSYRSLVTLLHEIGHIETIGNRNQTRAEEENLAVRWQVNRLKEIGLPIKRKILQSYKSYIARTYNRGIKRGLKKRIKTKLYL